LVAQVPGDTAECGVFEGAGSYLIAAAALGHHQTRVHHLFDSFEGLSQPSTHDGEAWRAHDMAVGLERAQATLSAFSNLRWHKGWIPDTLAAVADRRFAFVHVDVDLYEPTLASLVFFYPRMSPGGVIVCDDYGFTTCPGATKAVDDFLRDKPEKMIALPYGGGFFIAGVPTAATRPCDAVEAPPR
jgi:hypothetical protein